MTRTLFLSGLLMSMAVARSVHAQPARDPVAAEALFREGRDAFKKGDWTTACPKFAESQRLDPATGTLFNLADCLERAGKTATAWMHWRDVIDALRSNQTDERFGVAQQHAAALESKLPRLRVRWGKPAVDGAVVKRDGVELGSASIDAALPIDPGNHVIEVSAPGRKTATFSAVTKESQTTDVVIEAGELVQGATTDGPQPKLDPNPNPHPNPNPVPNPNGPMVPVTYEPHSSSALPVLGWTTLALGTITLVIGIGTGVGAIGNKSAVEMDCNMSKLCGAKGAGAAAEGHTFATVSTATIIIGSALVAGGIGFLIAGAVSGKSNKTAELPLWVQGKF